MDLHLDVDLRAGRRVGIERAVRNAIRQGRLPRGTQLPSSRQLASELGVARGTVVDAYAQLAVEGYVEPVHGGGTIVAHAPTEGPALTQAPSLYQLPSALNPGPRFDLRPGSPDPSSFPAPAWIAAMRRALRAAPLDAFSYGDPRGRHELRLALAGYLTRTRGVVADPERIVVCSGYSQAVASLARALVTVGQPRIAMEDPSLPAHRRLVEDAGAQVIPVPVDAQGIDVNRIRLAAPGAVITTPAHQYPLGVTLAPARRADLARWARHEGGVVIEDDYDGEFRFDRQPAGAMQALEPDHIVYAGTASKSLSPALRMGWLVLPAWLVEPFVAARGYGDTVSSIDQLTMADFIEGHGMDRHLRRMRSVYRRRRDALLATLARGPRPLALLGVAAGLHAVVDLRGTGHNEQGLLQQAGEAGIALGGLDDCWIADEGWDGLIVGYSRPAPHQFPATLAALTALLHGPGQPPR